MKWGDTVGVLTLLAHSAVSGLSGISAAASGYVTKPVDTQELLACMERRLIGS